MWHNYTIKIIQNYIVLTKELIHIWVMSPIALYLAYFVIKKNT